MRAIQQPAARPPPSVRPLPIASTIGCIDFEPLLELGRGRLGDAESGRGRCGIARHDFAELQPEPLPQPRESSRQCPIGWSSRTLISRADPASARAAARSGATRRASGRSRPGFARDVIEPAGAGGVIEPDSLPPPPPRALVPDLPNIVCSTNICPNDEPSPKPRSLRSAAAISSMLSNTRRGVRCGCELRSCVVSRWLPPTNRQTSCRHFSPRRKPTSLSSMTNDFGRHKMCGPAGGRVGRRLSVAHHRGAEDPTLGKWVEPGDLSDNVARSMLLLVAMQ